MGSRALGCFHGLISIQTFRWALTASEDSCAEIKIVRPFSGVTSSGRVWRKVWLVAFTKVKLMVANCASAKCSEEHVYHKKWQSHVYPESLSGNMKCTNVAIQPRQHSLNSNSSSFES